MQETMKSADTGVGIRGQSVTNLRFVDDTDLVAESQDQLQELTDGASKSSKRFGLKINAQKTKAMTVGRTRNDTTIKLENEEFEQVDEFVYLGSVITQDGKCMKDIKRRIVLASEIVTKLNSSSSSSSSSRNEYY